ncbi:hypothetical protein H2200_008359 [Cladophialophora chaetospira]|uniref:Uncharacterized protein n=1 Tax=Cladophialophora chaetospira TaxID=386627 RepID=A0AA39CGI3_9EURO|nr:hypothetical protein H2200_008359 [Cladophialophora chaetospira]
MKEELRHQSAQAQRRDTAGEQRQHSSTTLRQDVLPSRQEPMARRDNQPIRRPTETGNDPRTSLPEGFDTLHVHDTQGYTTTTRSNPIFPREEGGRVPSAGQSIPGRSGNAAVPIYSSSPPAHIQPTTSFGRTSQTSSRQPMSQYGTNPTPVFSQYPAYSSSQMAPSSFATTSYTPVSRDTTRPERNTTIYRDERSRREESSDRTGPETSRRMEQLPLTRTIPQRDSLDDRNPERVSSTTQISSYQPSLSSSFDEPGLGPFTVRRDQPRSSQPWPEARPQDEPTAIFSATHPPRSYHEAIPSAESEMTQPITTSYTQRQPSERDSSPPRSRTGRRQLDDTLRDDRVSPAPTTRRRQELIREERPSYERRTSQPQTTRPSRMPPDDEDSDSRASPAPTAQRRRESVKEDRPAHVRRRSSIEQQTSRTNPRTSRPSLEGENDESRDQQPTSRVSEGRPRRDVPSRELTSRPSLEEEDEDPRDRQPVSRASEGRPRRDPSDRERVRRR